MDWNPEDMRFADRREAGRELATQLSDYAGRGDVIVLGLPRGGVPVAAEVAAALHAPLDVLLVRKLGVPGHEEFAMGAIASGGAIDLDVNVVRQLGLTRSQIEGVLRREVEELERRERAYRHGRPMQSLRGKTVIVVDDGLATGSTMRAAVSTLRKLDPARIVVAAPVASNEACDDLGRQADECTCVSSPEPFYAVGAWYRDFTPTTDEEVTSCLERFGDGGTQIEKLERVQGKAGP